MTCANEVPRVIAVDWSGRRRGAKQHIWMARVQGGQLRKLQNGRTRENIVEDLINEANRYPSLIVGLDFAFSFPEWFVRDRGAQSAPAMWRLVARDGEQWLKECKPPSGADRGSRSRRFRNTIEPQKSRYARQMEHR